VHSPFVVSPPIHTSGGAPLPPHGPQHKARLLQSGFQRVRALPCISCWMHVRTFVAVFSLDRITCHAVCALRPYIIDSPQVPQSHPSVVPGARGCRRHFRFHRRQQLALPLHGCRVSHVSSNEAGRTAYLSKTQDVGDQPHRRSWTAKKLISGCTWSPNPIHPCGLLETPISQV